MGVFRALAGVLTVLLAIGGAAGAQDAGHVPRGADVVTLNFVCAASNDLYLSAKKYRIYAEFVGSWSGTPFGKPRHAKSMRAVVTGWELQPNVKPYMLLSLHDCQFVPIPYARPILTLTRVAGFDIAAFPAPEWVHPMEPSAEVFSLLVEYPPAPHLLAATKLSHFVTGRYAPSAEWRGVWLSVAVGDGSLGLLEGFSSAIDYQGRNLVRYWERADCTGESAFALALAGKVLNDSRSSTTAGNLLNFLYTTSPLAQGPRADPGSPSYGLLGWATASPQVDIYYGDDNARALLGTIGAATVLKSDKYDEFVVRALLANFRTSGKYGFREDSINEENLQKNGWRHYFDGESLVYAPHYQAYLWACYLWAYHKTGYQPFLERAKTAITMTMDT
ncbi:MAG: hypothetical protein NTZ09_13515, partial [Candidatus Hydrogenedentes bacterium]|nr:hypothetical protein [Candidatus Hydrogenedentota bacterium]